MRNQSGSDTRRRRVIATLAAGVLALTGAVAIGVGVAGQEPAPPSAPVAKQSTQVASPSASPSAQPSTQGRPSADAQEQQKSSPSPSSAPSAAEQPAEGLGFSEPVSLRIPSINAKSSSLEHLGLNSEGVMTTPEDPGKAGWFTPSPAPGVHGVSVIAGHVTWNQDRAVFFRLGELRKGDLVKVGRKDGVTAVFEVTKIGEFPKDEFPTEAVYQPVGHPALRLITCGGAYDEATNNYLANVIVWAKLVDSVKA